MSALVFLLSIFFINANAHEVRPGFLEIKSQDQKNYNITWKTPMRGNGVLSIKPIFPDKCQDSTPIEMKRVPGALIEKRQLNCGIKGLIGEKIYIKNLTSTLTDVLVRMENQDAVQTIILKPQKPSFIFKGSRSWINSARDFIQIGMEHILIGIDHLLFILGLLLIVSGKWTLLKTITSFTVAHSLTLGLSALNVVKIPIAPIEAIIALSIFFLGMEIVRSWRGETSLMINYPWIISFLFGLLHGFGFATGLSLSGIPQGEIPFTLLLFNIGVELGQLAFLTVALLIISILRPFNFPIWLKRVPGYLVGSAGAFWFIQRTLILI